MATSGSSSFNLNIVDVIEEAYERCGLKMRTGDDLRSARRSIDLLMLEWQNKGINFWTVEETTTATVASTTSVTLESDTVDVLDVIVRTGSGTTQVDYPVTRVSQSVYASYSNKGTEGRPINFWMDKQRDAPVLHLYPTPDTAYSLVYYKLRRIEDTGADVAADQMDVPTRFLPALVAGLAVKIAEKKAPARLADLTAMYVSVWNDAEAGDRDRASWQISPFMGSL